MKKIKLGKTCVGYDQPPYFIADIGANHDGDIDRAFKLIELAKEAGADAAKFQNFKANKIVSKVGFEKLGTQMIHQSKWKKSVFEVYKDASLSDDWTKLLKEKCDKVGIEYFTSPYDFESVDLVDEFVDFYKIGSGDITWTEIIEHIASKNKPVIIATGASDLEDVERAMSIISKKTREIVLMQCNTNYTTDINKHKYVNLNVLKTYAKNYPEVILGLSDHTFGHATVLGAISLGARVIEKHFTDDNNRVGPDHKFAMNPHSWKEMIFNSKILFESLGDGIKVIEENEKDSLVVQRRCIRASRNLEAGHIIKAEDFISLRPIPSDAIPPYKSKMIIGKELKVKILKGEHFTYKNFK